jgi:hypothetical protein
MMINSPQAASGVRPRRILVMPGRIKPNAPSTSQRPMNLRRSIGSMIELGGAISFKAASDMNSFVPPAKRNSSASRI